MNKSVAITGLAPVSAIGTGKEEFWRNLIAGKTGFRVIKDLKLPKRGCRIAAEVMNPPRKPLDAVNPLPRGVELALCAARLAVEDANLTNDIDRERVGLVVRTGIGNQDLTELSLQKMQAGEKLSPLTAFRTFAHAAACEIVREFDLRGAIQTVTSGCNSGADALGLALDWIRLGRCDVVIVGGVEAEITASFFGAMSAARALTAKFNDNPSAASRPFDARRDGNVPGEGAAFLVLESSEHAEKRRAEIYAKLLGFANCAAGTRPSYDPFNPIFDAAPMLRTMRTALKDAEISADEISSISANGSSIVFYDPLKAQAIAELLGERVAAVPVYSIKGALGQTGAVTPTLQAVAAALSIKNGILPATCNIEEQDSRCSINVVKNISPKHKSKVVLSNAIGFGGFYYAATVFGK